MVVVVLGLHLQLHGQAFCLLLVLIPVVVPPWGVPSWVVQLVSWQPHHCLGPKVVDGVLEELAPPEGSERLGAQGLHSQENQDN